MPYGPFTVGQSFVGSDDALGGAITGAGANLVGHGDAASDATALLTITGSASLAGHGDAASSATALLTLTGGEPTPQPTPTPTPTSPWRLYARDSALKRTALVDISSELTVILRRNAVSSWSLTLPASSSAAAELLGERAGVQLLYQGETVLSGPVTHWVRTHSTDTDEIAFFGASDDIWLARRVAHQQPTASAPPYSAEFDTRTGAAETVILAYINANLGGSALAERQLPGLSVPPSFGRGGFVTGKARMQTLLDLIADLALAGGDLGVRLYATPSGYLVEVSEPRNLTALTIFGQPGRGNLGRYEYGIAAPSATAVYVGGAGDGVARQFAIGTDPTGIASWGRIETFADARSGDGATELAQSVNEALDELAAIADFRAEPVQAIAGARFWLDWRLGDRVTFLVDGVSTEAVIRQVDLKFGPEGLSVACNVAATQRLLTDASSSIATRAISSLLGRMHDVERQR